jgi:hypothetical protein
MVAELAAWLQQPPSSDLPEFLTRMAGAIEANTDSVRATADAVIALARTVNTLPAELEKVVRG